MRIVSALGGALLLATSAQLVHALPRTPADTFSQSRHEPVDVARQALAETASYRDRIWRRQPGSPFYSTGYPRLYYYPWGVEPRTHLRRWRHY